MTKLQPKDSKLRGPLTWRRGLTLVFHGPRRTARAWEVRSKLSDSQMRGLISNFNRLPLEKQDVACSVLGAGPLPSDVKSREILARVLPAITRKRYPYVMGRTAWRVWRKLDPAAAERFIMEEVAVERTPNEQLAVLALDVAACGESLGVRQRLEYIGSKGGKAAFAAGEMLGRRFPSDTRLRELGTRWRDEGTSAALAALHEAFIEKHGYGVATENDVRDAFGEPHQKALGAWIYLPERLKLMFFFGSGKLEASELTSR